jgi:alkylated DNA repair dioxygenase AlkB|tara:strand:- start:233 stop:946 length:714 start_codon:yes stop_codon:yes gene_type:complete
MEYNFLKAVEKADDKFFDTIEKEKINFLQNRFQEQGFVLVKNFLSEEVADLVNESFEIHYAKAEYIEKYFENTIPISLTKPNIASALYGRFGKIDKKMGFANRDLHSYAYSVGEALLKKKKDFIENISQQKLDYTNSFCRKYTEGSSLGKHKDRPALQVSATICLGGEKWEIFIKDKSDNTHSITMSAGDAIVYSGTELEHWREKLDKGYVNMCFIHYCKKDSEYKLDGREFIGQPR